MRILTTQQLADRWGLKEGTLRNWRTQGKGPEYKKLGEGSRGYVVYDLDSVIQYENKYLMAVHKASRAKPQAQKSRSIR